MSLFRLIAACWGLARAVIYRARSYTFLVKTDIRLSRSSIEDRVFKVAIAQMVMAWANIEVLLDYINAIIITETKASSTKLPMFLNPKLRLLRKFVTTIEALAPVRKRALKLIDEIDPLKDVRHDIIHGRIRKSVDNSLMERKIIRHRLEDGILVPYTKDYTLEEIADATDRMLDITDNLFDLLDKIETALQGQTQ